MAEFNQHKPIYLQIADTVCDKILSGEYLPGERIPSVRELGASLGVNPNTIMRTYEYLQTLEIIFNSRGIGYSASIDAREKIVSAQKKIFLEEELPNLLKRLKLLGIEPEEIISRLK